MQTVPAHLQGILWSKKIDEINLEKDKVYIIHQVLSLGNLEAIRWLFKAYTPQEIKDVFIGFPRPVYTKPALHFVKKFILKLRQNVNITDSRYVKHVH